MLISTESLEWFSIQSDSDWFLLLRPSDESMVSFRVASIYFGLFIGFWCQSQCHRRKNEHELCEHLNAAFSHVDDSLLDHCIHLSVVLWATFNMWCTIRNNCISAFYLLRIIIHCEHVLQPATELKRKRTFRVEWHCNRKHHATNTDWRNSATLASLFPLNSLPCMVGYIFLSVQLRFVRSFRSCLVIWADAMAKIKLQAQCAFIKSGT